MKPPANACPERYCFFWAESGSLITPPGKAYASIQDAFPDLRRVLRPSCRLGPGGCSRNCEQVGERDSYEACEPELESAGLPWFYFVPAVTSLKAEFRERYIRESRKLWGDHDGIPPSDAT